MPELLSLHYPQMLAIYGAGPIVAAQLVVTAGGNPHRIRNEAAFANLCGVAPIPASSGRTNRHRLNRGGDRRGNNALHRITLVRMQRDQRTQDYVARRRQQGKNTKEINALPQTRHRPRGLPRADHTTPTRHASGLQNPA